MSLSLQTSYLFAIKKTDPVAELCDYAHAQCKVECHHRTANADMHPNYMYIVTTVIIIFTSKLKILRFKKREYSDGIKRKETRLGLS